MLSDHIAQESYTSLVEFTLAPLSIELVLSHQKKNLAQILKVCVVIFAVHQSVIKKSECACQEK